MAVGLPDVRSQIADQPRLCVQDGEYEMIAAPADGNRSAFFLRFMNANISSVTVWMQVPGTNGVVPSWEQIAPSDPSFGFVVGNDPNGRPVVTFAQAPPAGAVFGAQYLVTAFTDLELMAVLANNARGSDQDTLYAVHYAIIPRILSNRDAMMVYRINDRTDDPSAFQRNLLALRAQLKVDLLENAGEDAGVGISHTYGYGW